MEIEKIVNEQFYLSSKIIHYQNSFIDAFKNVNSDYIEEKLLARFSDKDQFLQSLMETIVYRHFCRKGFSLSFDQLLNKKNKKDVDIVARKNNIALNIEVKCPTTEEKNEKNIVLRQVHRYYNSKEDNVYFSDSMEKLQNKINFNLNQRNSEKQMKIGKMQDNKLKDYLLSANSKFSLSNANELNVLFLCLTTNEFMLFLEYMINTDTGLFSGNSYVDPNDFEKIDCFVLSNIKSGHYKYDLTSFDANFDIWDINKYVNFIIPNVANKQRLDCQFPKCKEMLLENLHDSYFNYCRFAVQYAKKHPDVPQSQYMIFPEYISINFPLLFKEYKEEIKSILDNKH